MEGCPRAAAAAAAAAVSVSAWFRRIGGFFFTWLFVRTLIIHGGYLGCHSQFSARFFGLPPGCQLLDKSRGSKSAEVQRVWGIL